jgi:hypothetical protein
MAIRQIFKPDAVNVQKASRNLWILDYINYQIMLKVTWGIWYFCGELI